VRVRGRRAKRYFSVQGLGVRALNDTAAARHRLAGRLDFDLGVAGGGARGY
jgi:hypothetical protein